MTSEDVESTKRKSSSDTKRKLAVPGYGPPKSTDYPNIENIVDTETDGKDGYSREELQNCETINHGYMFYVIRNAVFAKDISGYFYKLNSKTKQFEWFTDGWLEDSEHLIGQTIPSAPTHVSFNKHGLPVFPMNDEKPPKPILPRNENGEKVFPIDSNTSLPLFPVDFYGEPCIPVGEDGKPIFPVGADRRPIVPIDSQGVAVFPRDAQGNVLFPEREDGRPIPPYTVYGNPVIPFKENGEPDIPLDANGHPLIYLGGEDGMTPMTEEEYQQWQFSAAIYGHIIPNTYEYNEMEMSQNEQMLEAYKNSYYQQYQHAAMHMDAAYGDTTNANSQQKTPAELEAEKKKKMIAMQIKSLKKTKGLVESDTINENSDNGKGKEGSQPPITIPVNRPPLPNKEKERGERYIPEKIEFRHFNRNDRKEDRHVGYNRDGRGFRNFRGDRNDGRRIRAYNNSRNEFRRSRSRSIGSKRKRRRSASPSSRSTSRSTDVTRIRRRKSVSRSRSRSVDRSRRRERKSVSRSRSRSATWSPERKTRDTDKSPKKIRDGSSSDEEKTNRERSRTKDKSAKKENKSGKKEKAKKLSQRNSGSSESECDDLIWSEFERDPIERDREGVVQGSSQMNVASIMVERIVAELKTQTTILQETREFVSSRTDIEQILKFERLEMEKRIREELEIKISEEWRQRNNLQNTMEQREMIRIQHMESIERSVRECLEKTNELFLNIVKEKEDIAEKQKEIENKLRHVRQMNSKVMKDRFLMRMKTFTGKKEKYKFL